MKTRKPPVLVVRKIQKYLFDYLSIDVDPYDFPHRFLEEWGQEVGIEIGDDDHADSLKPDQLKAYERWLRDNDKGSRWVTDDPYGSAAYLTINGPTRMPVGTWGIHFTNEDPFHSFDFGSTLEGLHLSTWRKKKVEADCERNISDELGTFEYVWAFAFEALGAPVAFSRDILSYGSRKYGRNAILFQTDGAVKAWHSGDEEYQLIFPACSEYNVIPLRSVRDGISCAFGDSEEDGLTFESVKDLIDYVEQAEARGERPLARLQC